MNVSSFPIDMTYFTMTTNKQTLFLKLRNKAPAGDVNDATMRTFAGEKAFPT